MSPSAESPPSPVPDLRALEAVSAAVESGAGLPDVVRAAARALDASLAVIDRTSSVLAVAARSPVDERALIELDEGVESYELRVADEVVGQLRVRARTAPPAAAVVRLVTTFVAGEVQRVRAPERASAAAAHAFLQAILTRKVTDRGDLVARGQEVGIDLSGGGTVVVARAHALAPAEEGWRGRMLSVAERAARAIAPGAIAGPYDGDEHATAAVVLLVPTTDESMSRRVADLAWRELTGALPGFAFAIGRSRVAADPVDLHHAASEAVLAANVADGDGEHSILSFDETGAYRLLLPAMSEDPAELQRFYAETVEPLVVYDEQYETDLVMTLETFLDCDGNVAGTAQRLFTHRHTVRYRLERIRELSGLDVGSSDGREKLSLGLKAMRVLGIGRPVGPATETGAEGGRVPPPRSAER